MYKNPRVYNYSKGLIIKVFLAFGVNLVVVGWYFLNFKATVNCFLTFPNFLLTVLPYLLG